MLRKLLAPFKQKGSSEEEQYVRTPDDKNQEEDAQQDGQAEQFAQSPNRKFGNQPTEKLGAKTIQEQPGEQLRNEGQDKSSRTRRAFKRFDAPIPSLEIIETSSPFPKRSTSETALQKSRAEASKQLSLETTQRKRSPVFKTVCFKKPQDSVIPVLKQSSAEASQHMSSKESQEASNDDKTRATEAAQKNMDDKGRERRKSSRLVPGAVNAIATENVQNYQGGGEESKAEELEFPSEFGEEETAITSTKFKQNLRSKKRRPSTDINLPRAVATIYGMSMGGLQQLFTTPEERSGSDDVEEFMTRELSGDQGIKEGRLNRTERMDDIHLLNVLLSCAC